MLKNKKKISAKKIYSPYNNKKKKKNQKKQYQESAFIKKIKKRLALRAFLFYKRRLKKKLEPQQFQPTMKGVILRPLKYRNIIRSPFKANLQKKIRRSVYTTNALRARGLKQSVKLKKIGSLKLLSIFSSRGGIGKGFETEKGLKLLYKMHSGNTIAFGNAKILIDLLQKKIYKEAVTKLSKYNQIEDLKENERRAFKLAEALKLFL